MGLNLPGLATTFAEVVEHIIKTAHLRPTSIETVIVRERRITSLFNWKPVTYAEEAVKFGSAYVLTTSHKIGVPIGNNDNILKAMSYQEFLDHSASYGGSNAHQVARDIEMLTNELRALL